MKLYETMYFDNVFQHVSTQLGYNEDVVCVPTVLIIIDFIRSLLLLWNSRRLQPVTSNDVAMASYRFIT